MASEKWSNEAIGAAINAIFNDNGKKICDFCGEELDDDDDCVEVEIDRYLCRKCYEM